MNRQDAKNTNALKLVLVFLLGVLGVLAVERFGFVWPTI
jgi:hypothetical protein